MSSSVPSKSGEVEAGIHCVTSVYAAEKPLSIYVVDGTFALWADVGINTTPQEHVIPYLMEHAPGAWGKLQLALITHADVDHFGGLTSLTALRPDVVVLAHREDKHWIESPDAIMRERYLMHEPEGITISSQRREVLHERGGGGGKVHLALAGGEMIDLGPGGTWLVLHAPGHSNGHVILWEPEKRWAIIGDAALSWGVPNVSGRLITPPPYYDVAAYEQTVRMLLDLRAERIFTSHYGILDRDGAEQLFANSLQVVDTLEAALSKALRQHRSGIRLDFLCSEVGQLSASWDEALWPGLADAISAHLKRQLALGKVERVLRDGHPAYRLT